MKPFADISKLRPESKKFILITSLLMIAFMYLFLTAASTKVPTRIKAQEMETPVIPLEIASNLNEFFRQNVSYNSTISPTYFGAWVLEANNELLYLGLGANIPTTTDGALLAKLENNILSPILNNNGQGLFNPIYEQGINRMQYLNNTLYIGGIDASGGDDWSFGNIYTYTEGGQIIKHRNLTNVLHVFDLFVDNNNIYTSTGSHTGNNTTMVGQVFKSTPEAINSPDPDVAWPPEGRFDINNFRVLNIIKNNNNLYVIEDPGDGNSYLKESKDEGNSWIRISDVSSPLGSRMLVFQGSLLAYGAFNNIIYSVDSWDNVTSYPAVRPIQTLSYNSWITDNNYLYMLTGDNKIIRTNNFTDWYLVSEFSEPLLSITYWPGKNALAVASRGSNAKLWLVDLLQANNLPPISPVPTSTPTPPIPTSTPTPPPIISTPTPISSPFTLNVFPGYNLVSIPFFTNRTSIQDILGNQLTGGNTVATADRVLKYSVPAGNTSSESAVLYTDGIWYQEENFPTVVSNMQLNPYEGFFIQHRGVDSTHIQIAGEVLAPKVGDILVTNGQSQYLGVTFLNPVNIQDINQYFSIPMIGSDSPQTAESILYFNKVTQQYQSVWYCGGTICESWGNQFYHKWLNNDYAEANLLINPGDGFIFTARSVVPTPTSTEADFNNDGIVNFMDVMILLLDYVQAGSRADLNGDGKVNGMDFGRIFFLVN